MPTDCDGVAIQVVTRSMSAFVAKVERIRDEWCHRKGELDPWFRGQSSVAFSLVPGLYRFGRRSIDEHAYRHEFRLRAFPFLSESTYAPTTQWDWYFLMQHYGLPTRLLDWSESSLVALYFAMQADTRVDTKVDAAVWMLDPWQLTHRVAGKRDAVYAYDGTPVAPWLPRIWSRRRLPQAPIAIQPPANSRRLVAQRGMFTIHGASKRPIQSYSSLRGGLVKFIVPAAARTRVLRDLLTAGVTESVLFPSLDGLSREVKSTWTQRLLL